MDVFERFYCRLIDVVVSRNLIILESTISVKQFATKFVQTELVCFSEGQDVCASSIELISHRRHKLAARNTLFHIAQ